MTDHQMKTLLLTVLTELDSLLCGCEKTVYHDDDPSGLFTEYMLDTEAFRDALQRRIEQLRKDTGENA